ncbi:unnamed protein product, partial [Brachionus calyciflorus]
VNPDQSVSIDQTNIISMDRSYRSSNHDTESENLLENNANSEIEYEINL